MLCIPNSIGNKNSAGIINWLKKGAKIVTNADEILQEIGLKSGSIDLEKINATKKQQKIEEFEQKELKQEQEIAKKIYYQIKENGETSAEFLCNYLKVSIQEINAFLSSLEIKGLVENTHGTYYKVSDNLYV